MHQSMDAVAKLRQEKDLLAYLKLLREVAPRYVVFITVCDTGAGQYFTTEHVAAMADLGLKINMLNRFRAPYIAAINEGEVVWERTSDRLDEPLTLEGTLNDHDFWVYSAGFECQVGIGCGAYVKIDGADYLLCCRGFNFLIYDLKKDIMVHRCGFDTYALRTNNGNLGGDNTSVAPILLGLAEKWGGGTAMHIAVAPIFNQAN